MSIKVDPEFMALIPPLTPEEFAQLEENCVKEGIRDALVGWKVPNGDIILIDGHNRWEIAAKHGGIQFKIKEMQFDNREAVKAWIIRNQLGRRNLSKYDRSLLALKLEPIIAEKAKEQQGARTDICQKSDKSIDTKKELAKIAGVSHDTIHKVKTIQNSGDQQLIKDIREGRETINSGYQKVHPKKTPAQSMKETLEEAKQEHEDFKSNKTVSIYEAQMDKANRHIIAIDLYNRLLTMGKRINDVAVDMEEGSINIGEMCKTLDQSKVKELKTSIRIMYEQLMRIDKELKIG